MKCEHCGTPYSEEGLSDDPETRTTCATLWTQQCFCGVKQKPAVAELHAEEER